MMRKASPLFLERRSYRLRRLMDAARLLPFFGALLFAVPMLWSGAEPGDEMVSSRAIVYIFGVWIVLVAISLILSLFLDDASNAERETPQPPLPPLRPRSHGDDDTAYADSR